MTSYRFGRPVLGKALGVCAHPDARGAHAAVGTLAAAARSATASASSRCSRGADVASTALSRSAAAITPEPEA